MSAILIPSYKEATVSIPDLNAFCRKYDLVFMEEGRVRGDPVYWFVDFDNRKRYYTAAEIESKLGS
jgi:hypothetical protein